jgi:hypothetical protein
MKKTVVALIMLATLSLASCTSNEMAKQFGGISRMNLPKGEKLVNITWKEDHIWYLTKPMTETDVAETYTFKEQSNYGILQGEVIITEFK